MNAVPTRSTGVSTYPVSLFILLRHAFRCVLDSMIRHTKAQHIDGAAALALPCLASETQWLAFSAHEKTAYNSNRRYLHFSKRLEALRCGKRTSTSP